jgi:hypothetical protein
MAFPQMTEFITGQRPDDPKFVRARRAFLLRLGQRLFGDDVASRSRRTGRAELRQNGRDERRAR